MAPGGGGGLGGGAGTTWAPAGCSSEAIRGTVSSQGSGELLELLLPCRLAEAPSAHPWGPVCPSGSLGGCNRRGAGSAGSLGQDWQEGHSSRCRRFRRSSRPASADKSPWASAKSWAARPWPVAMCRGQGGPSGVWISDPMPVPKLRSLSVHEICCCD